MPRCAVTALGERTEKILTSCKMRVGLSLGGVAKLEQVGDSPMQSGIDYPVMNSTQRLIQKYYT